MAEYHTRKIVARNQVEDDGFNLFKGFIQGELFGRGIDSKLSNLFPALEQDASRGVLKDNKKNVQRLGHVLKNRAATFSTGNRKGVANVALFIAQQYELHQLTLNTLMGLVEKFAPQFKDVIDNVLSKFFLLLNLLVHCETQVDKLGLQGSQWKILATFSYFTFRVVQMSVCSVVQRHGGWEKVVSFVEKHPRDTALVLATIAAVISIVGLAVFKSQRRNK